MLPRRGRERGVSGTAAWDAERYEQDFSFVPDMARDLLQWLNPQPGERILDLGCGTGALTATIAETGAFVEGLDLDERMLAVARREHPEIPFRRADAQEFSVTEPKDAIFSNAVLHWVPDQERTFRQVAAALKPGGRLVVEMGGHRNIDIVKGALRSALAAAGVPYERQPRLWFFPTPGQQCARLEAQGMEVRRLAYFDRPTPLDLGEQGLSNWLWMFAGSLLELVPPGRREEVLTAVAEATRGDLYREGRWVMDYVRLRFLAVRV